MAMLAGLPQHSFTTHTPWHNGPRKFTGPLLRDVLAASLAMQLLALATPLCTQVIIDKVVAHHAQSTLVVIVAALALFMIFSAALVSTDLIFAQACGERTNTACARFSNRKSSM